jgi:hypothetical protein
MGYRLIHWGPILAFTVITAISTSTVICHCEWWPLTTTSSVLNIVGFAIWNICTLYNFFCAAYAGPGYVPFGWKPYKEDDTQYLQFCAMCQTYKAPRSHHCRKCRRCVMKMDHHCPWINNCVGHFNHAYFTAFLFFAPCGCIHALFVLLPALYRAVFKNYYIFYGTGGEPLVSLGFTTLIGSMLSVGLAVGVTIALGGLLFIQLRSIVRNETGIESWIKDKAESRDKRDNEAEFIYPYDLGTWHNIRMVLYCGHRPELDGVWWPVRPGCNQYTLTVEQLEQKREKRQRSAMYVITKHFTGTMCPWKYGPPVVCCQPCIDEQRMKVEPGHHVLVSRFRKHWLYGDLITVGSDGMPHTDRCRGWFPRQSAMRLKKGSNCSHVENTPVDNRYNRKDD